MLRTSWLESVLSSAISGPQEQKRALPDQCYTLVSMKHYVHPVNYVRLKPKTVWKTDGCHCGLCVFLLFGFDILVHTNIYIYTRSVFKYFVHHCWKIWCWHFKRLALLTRVTSGGLYQTWLKSHWRALFGLAAVVNNNPALLPPSGWQTRVNRQLIFLFFQSNADLLRFISPYLRSARLSKDKVKCINTKI